MTPIYRDKLLVIIEGIFSGLTSQHCYGIKGNIFTIYTKCRNQTLEEREVYSGQVTQFVDENGDPIVDFEEYVAEIWLGSKNEIVNNYNTLVNTVNNLVSGSGDKNFTFSQNSPSTTWTINHNLSKKPSVTVLDSSGNEVNGCVNHIDVNNLSITFTNGFSGTAELN